MGLKVETTRNVLSCSLTFFFFDAQYHQLKANGNNSDSYNMGRLGELWEKVML